MSRHLKVRVGDKWYSVEVEVVSASPIRVIVDGHPVEVAVGRQPPANPPASHVEPENTATPLPAVSTVISETPPEVRVVRSPMPGVIISVSVKEGDSIVAGGEVCVLEAMKMRQTVRADWAGVVTAVRVAAGDQVLDGHPIVELG